MECNCANSYDDDDDVCLFSPLLSTLQWQTLTFVYLAMHVPESISCICTTSGSVFGLCMLYRVSPYVCLFICLVLRPTAIGMVAYNQESLVWTNKISIPVGTVPILFAYCSLLVSGIVHFGSYTTLHGKPINFNRPPNGTCWANQFTSISH